MVETIEPALHHPYASHGLFSEHYLTDTLPRDAGWQALAASDEMVTAFARVKDLFAVYSPSEVEAQTEEDLVKPVLAALGLTFEVQPALDTPGAPTKADDVIDGDLSVRARCTPVIDLTWQSCAASAWLTARYTGAIARDDVCPSRRPWCCRCPYPPVAEMRQAMPPS